MQIFVPGASGSLRPVWLRDTRVSGPSRRGEADKKRERESSACNAAVPLHLPGLFFLTAVAAVSGDRRAMWINVREACHPQIPLMVLHVYTVSWLAVHISLLTVYSAGMYAYM